MVVSAGKVADLQRVDMLSSLGEFSISLLVILHIPACKLSISSDSDSFIPWLDLFGNVRKRSPRVFLNLCEKLTAIHKEVDEKFLKTADKKKKASSYLPPWSEVYRLGNLDKFHKASRDFCRSPYPCRGMSRCLSTTQQSWRCV